VLPTTPTRPSTSHDSVFIAPSTDPRPLFRPRFLTRQNGLLSYSVLCLTELSMSQFLGVPGLKLPLHPGPRSALPHQLSLGLIQGGNASADGTPPPTYHIRIRLCSSVYALPHLLHLGLRPPLPSEMRLMTRAARYPNHLLCPRFVSSFIDPYIIAYLTFNLLDTAPTPTSPPRSTSSVPRLIEPQRCQCNTSASPRAKFNPSSPPFSLFNAGTNWITTLARPSRTTTSDVCLAQPGARAASEEPSTVFLVHQLDDHQLV
jgi:hypothetical protein